MYTAQYNFISKYGKFSFYLNQYTAPQPMIYQRYLSYIIVPFTCILMLYLC